MNHPNESIAARTQYDLLSPSFYADPHPILRQMRTEAPVYWHPDLQLWVLTRHADIQTVARDPRFSAERSTQFGVGASEAMKPKLEAFNRFVAQWAVFLDPPRHTVLRALLAKAFTPQLMLALKPMVEALVEEMLDKVVDSGQMDVVRDLASPLPAIVIGKMIGVPTERIEDFKGWTRDLFTLIGAGVATDEAIETSYRGVTCLEAYFRELIAERRREPKDDLLSRLIAVEEQGMFLSEEEMIASSAMLLVAGHETTTHLIGNSVLALLRNPAELQKLRDDPSLLENAVEELLRYDGAVFMMSRRAREDIEIDGVLIKAGQIAFGMVPAGNRDPAVYEDPDRLDVTRKGTRSLAFGHGIHFCIGAALARIEAVATLRAVLRRLPQLRLADDSPAWIPSLAIHGLVALPVTFQPRAATRSLDRLPLSKRSASLSLGPTSSREASASA